MASVTNALTTFSIATANTAATTAAAYKALTWNAVGNVTNVGDFGDVFNKIEAKVLGTRRVQKAKGSVDGGSWEITVLRDAADVGQNALRTASKLDTPVNVKLELGDKPTTGASPTGSIFYAPAIVFAAPVKAGESDSFVEQTFTVEIVGEIVEVAPSAT